MKPLVSYSNTGTSSPAHPQSVSIVSCQQTSRLIVTGSLAGSGQPIRWVWENHWHEILPWHIAPAVVCAEGTPHLITNFIFWFLEYIVEFWPYIRTLTFPGRAWRWWEWGSSTVLTGWAPHMSRCWWEATAVLWCRASRKLEDLGCEVWSSGLKSSKVICIWSVGPEVTCSRQRIQGWVLASVSRVGSGQRIQGWDLASVSRVGRNWCLTVSFSLSENEALAIQLPHNSKTSIEPLSSTHEVRWSLYPPGVPGVLHPHPGAIPHPGPASTTAHTPFTTTHDTPVNS